MASCRNNVQLRGTEEMGKKKRPTQIHRQYTQISLFPLFILKNIVESPACIYTGFCPPEYGGANHHQLYGVAAIYGNFGMI